jgi:N-acetylneuraminic acid mutarotase
MKKKMLLMGILFSTIVTTILFFSLSAISAGFDRCGTPTPTADELTAVQRAIGKSSVTIQCTVTIPVAFHILRYDNGITGDVSDSQINNQLTVLNNAYASTNFRFSLHSIERINNTVWSKMSTPASENSAKSGLAIDPSHTLNIYTCTECILSNRPALGWSYLPNMYTESSYMHGVVVLYSTFPGGASYPYNEGDTLTHEVGHYMGLYHTFQGGCVTPGDQVDDTPYEGSPAYGCPIARDTCPTSAGLDPVTNFMDYTDDSCMNTFTSGQSDRIDSMVATYKPSLISCDVPDITVNDSIYPINDKAISFGDVAIGSSSTGTVTVSNEGNSSLKIGQIASSNPIATPFQILNDNCSNQVIAPSNDCTMEVKFAPTILGSFNDSFDIPSDDPDENPVTFTVSGTGTQTVADITVTDSIGSAFDLQMPFGNLTDGLSIEKTVKITNDGTANLIIGYIALNNHLALPFEILNDNCSNKVLAPTDNCTITVKFAPTILGSFNDSFDIPSNDVDENPVTVTVSGTGLPSSNNPPSIPKLVYPANGQTGLGTTVTFKWEKCSDPEKDNVTYYLYYSEDPNFIGGTSVQVTSLGNKSVYYAETGIGFLLFGIVFASGARIRKKLLLMFAMIVISTILFVSCGGGGGGGGGGDSPAPTPQTSNEIIQNVSGLKPNTTYYWKVKVDDGNGGITESATYNFTTVVIASGWSTVPSMSYERYWAASAVYGDSLYVFGGGGLPPYNKVEKFDLITSKWTTLNNMPVSKFLIRAATVGNYIYVFDGSGNNDVYLYDPAGDSWTQLNDMPSCEWMGNPAVVQGKIYIIGCKGFPSGADGKVLEYNPSNDSWTVKTPMPTARYGPATAVYNNKIYVLGGNYGTSKNEVYDPVTDSWNAKADVIFSNYGWGVAGTIGNKIYFVDSGSGGTFAVYDPSNNTWTSLDPLPTPRDYLTGDVMSNILFVIGGMDNGGDSTKIVEIYNPSVASARALKKAYLQQESETIHKPDDVDHQQMELKHRLREEQVLKSMR